jgi:hypothetical protein
MVNPANVVQAIESFDSWSTPWEFYPNVLAFPALNDADRESLEQAWSAACDQNVWLSTDSLVAGVAATEAVLGERFPFLSTLARQQLARAASYQWR